VYADYKPECVLTTNPSVHRPQTRVRSDYKPECILTTNTDNKPKPTHTYHSQVHTYREYNVPLPRHLTLNLTLTANLNH